MEVKNIDSIYQYTESILNSQDKSINQLNTKFNGFIIATGLLIRLSVDLKDEYSITKVIIGVLCIVILMVCVQGLLAKNKGKTCHPKVLLKSQYINKGNTFHQVIICKERSKVIDEYYSFMQTQQKKLNLVVGMFTFTIGIYSFTLFGLEPLIRNLIDMIS